MSELFKKIKYFFTELLAVVEIIHEEDSSISSGEDLEPLECDCITSVPEELSDEVQEESEDNMLLSKKD